MEESVSTRADGAHYSRQDVDYVVGLFPELEAITAADLRRKVIEIWLDCWHESAWPRIEDAPKNPSDLGSERRLYQHVRAVTQAALATAEIVGRMHDLVIDRDTITAAGLLHDVSKLVEYEPVDRDAATVSARGRLIQHATYGAHKAWEKGIADEVVHIIVSHTRHSGRPPSTIEGVIVHYVDDLDSDALLIAAGKPPSLARHW
jgi:putative nucleotidyltransferase with HDIG domain